MVIHDILYTPDILTIDWKICTLCNYKCPYCYVRPMPIWGQIATKSIINKILVKISTSNYKFDISILGGEPTLHPLLHYILKRCESIDNIVNVKLITNASKPLAQYLQYNKVFIICSYHPFNSKNFQQNICDLDPARYSISIMMHKNATYPNWLYQYPHTEEYIIEDNEITAHSHTKNYVLNGDLASEYDIMELTHGNFYNWQCRLSHFSINPDGSIALGCESLKHLDDLQLLPKKVTCNKTCCIWSCLLGMYKAK